jgi:ABC-2 type transport system permease protein
VASSSFHAQLADYRSYVAALKQAGSAAPPPPSFFPLQLLRGAVEYLEIIGSIIAIVIGYGLAAKEKNRGTLRLIFSRPISGASVALGKLLALAAIWLTVIVALGVVMFAAIAIVGGATLTSTEVVKLVITLFLAWLYLFMWSAFAFALASYAKQLSTALVVGLILWLGFVLIVPQIGDTMDPDNQVPGGLFKSLQVAKPEEKAVLAHFTGYESKRNLLEDMSISKHFERAGFAYLGVKDQYNGQSLGYINADMWPHLVWIVGFIGLASYWAISQGKKRYLLGRE